MGKLKEYTILYVDDEESNLNIFKNTFRRDYNVLVAKTAREGLNLLETEKIDLILTDQRMPEMDGVTFLKQTMNQFPHLNRILITGYTDFDALCNAVNDAKIFQYIQKPWVEGQLKNVIEKALEVYELRQENESLTQTLIDKNIELEKLNQDLIELDHLKTDFLSLISHEIRTPLNGIVGVVDLLKMNLDEEQSNSISSLLYILETSVDRLEKFLLTAERITQFKAGIYRLKKVEFCMSTLIDDCVKQLNNSVLRNNITLNLSNTYKGTVIGDQHLIQYSFIEIIKNSMEQAPKCTKIDIRVFSENNHCFVEVSDNGAGFSANVLENAFQLFGGEHKADKNKGLSLALIKSITTAHHGDIQLSNKPEGGAKVRLWINTGHKNSNEC
ncbi:MAG: hybrid sensor histidine kinase/response regulator [Salinivirgaceae bacterium]|nr:hybrid sensor histidine kinase/response regulator [Salinivirgaceae bacterium]MDD4746800.1 hybrid sensor histidine kinase/response regulator [Salinivirgaceae bacterium]MDY0282254.1 hybrid sensor histidine kinase/response regulator [Salinivirgaceae bacterium]